MKCKDFNSDFSTCVLCKTNPEKVVCENLCPHEDVHYEAERGAYWCSDCNRYVEAEEIQERVNRDVEMMRTSKIKG